MPSTHPALLSNIEPLESRIAPALLINGANLLGGAGNPDSGETSIGGNESTLVKVTSGQALVWYKDGDVLGISFGPNTSIEVTGNVGELLGSDEYFLGSIVGNLTSEGRLSDSNNDPSDGEDGNVLLANNLLSLKTFPLGGENGDFASIITGGSVSNVSVHGKITTGIFAGDSVFRDDSLVAGTNAVKSISLGVIGPVLDPNPLDLVNAKGFALSHALAKFTAGASISNVDVETSQNMQLFAGSGGAATSASKGSAGGNISNVIIHSAFSEQNLESYVLRAGDGQNGVSGGPGGSITGVIEETSSGKVLVVAGRGGNGSGGPGGEGGSVSLLDLQSDSSAYTVVAGNGGNGVGGGNGGAATNNNFANTKPTNSLVITQDFTGDHVDDVLVIDSNTGGMILSKNQDGGANFSQVLQHVDAESGKPVFIIDSLGVTPVGALATDFDGDGDLDIVVAYKNSSNLGVYVNDGHGGFWNAKDKKVDGFIVGLGFSPTLLSVDEVGGTGLVVIEDDPGQSIMHHLTPNGLGYGMQPVGTGLHQFATAIVPATSLQGERYIYAATQSGLLISFSANPDPKKPAFDFNSQIRLSGNILNLDVDTSGHQLLALQAGSKGIALFEVGAGGILSSQVAPELNANGRPLLAKFVNDKTLKADSIAVLSALNAGSRLDLFDAREADADEATEDPPFVLINSLTTQPTLKNFGFAFNDSGLGVAGVAGSLSQFFFSPALSTLDSYLLPFTGKTVDISGGDGGGAFDSGKVLGKGGAGGGVAGFNADAIGIRLHTGEGGGSVNGPAGAGGSSSNPATFKSKSGLVVTPKLVADETLSVLVGDGGTASGQGVKALGGDGGSINGLTLSLGNGAILLTSGNGGASGKGGAAGGDGGDISAMKILSLSGDFIVHTGDGGDALAAGTGKSNAKAGNGGSISKLNYELRLDDQREGVEVPYLASVTTGKGGAALAGTGGAGGTLSDLFLKMDGADTTYNNFNVDPPLFNSHADSTVTISVRTGDGGLGKTGGAGGAVSGFASESVFDQITENGVFLNYVVLDLTSGKGGAGSEGAGGNGGNIAFAPGGIAGVTAYDPDTKSAPVGNPDFYPLRITAGAGGDASTKGGLGGSITSLVAKNALISDGSNFADMQLDGAIVTAGNGGAGTLLGAKGGDVSKAVIGVYGNLVVHSGSGGASGAAGVGGAGGFLGNSTFGTVAFGFELASGDGGAGGKSGGNGGSVGSLQVNTPDISEAKENSRIFAGHGGNASAAGGRAGAGGSITKLSQVKDINSAINLIEAGNGGDALAGIGGKGGSVSAVSTKGFIGSPIHAGIRLGIFDNDGVEQGLFAGRGGAGLTAGIAGAVSGVNARQIAAIAAAIDAGGNFAPASKVSGVSAEVIGYDINQNGTLDAGDGFLWASALSGVVKTVKLKK